MPLILGARMPSVTHLTCYNRSVSILNDSDLIRGTTVRHPLPPSPNKTHLCGLACCPKSLCLQDNLSFALLVRELPPYIASACENPQGILETDSFLNLTSQVIETIRRLSRGLLVDCLEGPTDADYLPEVETNVQYRYRMTQDRRWVRLSYFCMGCSRKDDLVKETDWKTGAVRNDRMEQVAAQSVPGCPMPSSNTAIDSRLDGRMTQSFETPRDLSKAA